MPHSLRETCSEEAILAALDAIKATNTYAAAASRLNISQSAFQKWREADPDLQQRCDEAKKEYWSHCEPVNRAIARRKATDILKNGTTTITSTDYEVLDNEGNRVTLTKVVEKVSPTPLRLIERYLGDSDLEDLSLVRALVMGGYLPESTLEEFESAVTEFKRHISKIMYGKEETATTIVASQSDLVAGATAAFRRIITKDATELSAKMDS
jgi:hypothetical protein